MIGQCENVIIFYISEGGQLRPPPGPPGKSDPGVCQDGMIGPCKGMPERHLGRDAQAHGTVQRTVRHNHRGDKGLRSTVGRFLVYRWAPSARPLRTPSTPSTPSPVHDSIIEYQCKGPPTFIGGPSS